MTPEQHDWTPILGFERYAISRAGLVFDSQKERIITPYIHKSKSRCYYYINLSAGYKKQATVKMHRLLATAFIPNPESLPVVDHISGNGLDNSLTNIRWASFSQNAQNQRKQANTASKYMGVHYHTATNKWRPMLRINGKRLCKGLYETEYEAALEFDRVALLEGVLHHNGLIQPRN